MLHPFHKVIGKTIYVAVPLVFILGTVLPLFAEGDSVTTPAPSTSATPTLPNASANGSVQSPTAPPPAKASGDAVSNIIKQKKIDSQLPDTSSLAAKLTPQAQAQQMQDDFNFAGYNKERISVEFQKMDLHNVFNFLRQVSGVNIVVDDSVQGSLTLDLDNVPWDFALDIILNLKGLEKEERFNTIVIYPKGKHFAWPQQAQNNLSFQADPLVLEKQSLTIHQRDRQTAFVGESKDLIDKGRAAEMKGDYDQAVNYYEQAFAKWKKNIHLANKISSIYLTHLNDNAKAMYYAQQALRIDKADTTALLYAAIAAAQMNDRGQAEQYFAKSVHAARPTREALLNYAAFCEETGSFQAALSLWNRFDHIYGRSLDSMIAVARVTDKMGNTQRATTLYRSILSSGFAVPADLKKYIQSRIARN